MRLRLTGKLGMLLLGVWLILWGVLNFSFGSNIILASLTIAAGVLIALER